MTTTLSRTQQNDIINLANSAVRSRVAKKYKGIFSTMDIEDMVGDTIYKACRSIGSFDASKGKLITWVNKIAVNAVIDAVDYKVKRLPISNAMFIENEEGEELDYAETYGHEAYENETDRDLLAEEFESEVRKVTGALSEQKRKTLDMVERGMTPIEMAAEEGCTPTAAATRKCRVLKEIEAPVKRIAEQFDIFPARKAA
ncbi:MAG: RNA polymerase sigma factor [Candidatus Cryptobacteroides sp.]